jgi:hypothetical protein
MKKIFILSILIVPIMAKADNVGPAAASGTPVVATSNAPYATVGAVNGDTTHVVTASYVKEAYNDAIAAVNKVNADKQGKLISTTERQQILSGVIDGPTVADCNTNGNCSGWTDADAQLITAGGVDVMVNTVIDYKRVNALTTWGSPSVSQLSLSDVE